MVVATLREPTSCFVAELGTSLVIVPGRSYDDNDPLVREHPWAFERSMVEVEQATAAPGEKRRTKRAASGEA